MSFKHKLVAFFMVLSLLPLAAAFWGFNAAAERSESAAVDARLQSGLRAALAAYQDEVAGAGARAERLATDPALRRALASGDGDAVDAIVSRQEGVAVRTRSGRIAGSLPALAGSRRVSVLSDRGLIGTVIVAVPLDDAFLERLRRRAALAEDDRLIVARDGLVLGGLSGVAGTFPRRLTGISTVTLDGERYRALAAPLASEPAGASLAVVSPAAELAAATRARQQRLLIGLAGSLLLIGAVAYALGRGIGRTLARLAEASGELARGRLGERVEVRGSDEFARLGHAFNAMAGQLEERVAELDAERGRLREATARLGEALSATHDREQLLRVVVETAMEATGATGAVIVDENGDEFASGRPGEGADRLELPLLAGRTSFGSLILTGEAFDNDERETAVTLASHATIALENARLHEIVERQALADGLTGLANRRHAEEKLAGELARAERYGGGLTLVMADLDDFKAVNDDHGHQVGDEALVALADILREAVREIDLAARWGGEEFALILPGTDLEGGIAVAERVRRSLEARALAGPEGRELRVTASFGVAAHAASGTAADLVAAADEALYEAKRAGKNRVQASVEPVRRP